MGRMGIGMPTRVRAIYVLLVLALVSLANYYDPNPISILVEPIKIIP